MNSKLGKADNQRGQVRRAEPWMGSAECYGSAAQPGAQGEAGLCVGLFPPSLVRPRRLARALGANGRLLSCTNVCIARSLTVGEKLDNLVNNQLPRLRKWDILI